MKNPDHRQFTLRLQELRKTCLELSGDMPSLAEDLQKGELGGVEKAAGKFLALHQEFAALKEVIITFAGSSQTVFDSGKITSLEALESLLLAANQGVKSAALAVLDHILSVHYRGAGDFEPLKSCLASAAELRRDIDKVPLPDLHPAAGNLATGIHPVALLLSLIREHGHMSEEKIAEIQDGIAGAFGSLLFIAAIMGNLILSEPAVQEEKGPAGEAAAEKLSDKPVLSLMPEASAEILEQRKIIHDLVLMTEMKINKMIRNGVAREDDLQEFVSYMNGIDLSNSGELDCKEYFRQLQLIRTALEDRENKAFNLRRGTERPQFLRRQS